MPDGGRSYLNRVTMFPVPGATGGAPVNVYSCNADPNGLIAWAKIGDRCFQSGVNAAWVAITESPSTWALWGSGGGGLLTQFVWNPGAEDDPDHGIYTDWNDVYAAAADVAVYGPRVVIWCDDRTDSLVIPEGEFDMFQIQLAGLGPERSSLGGHQWVDVATSEGTVFTNFYLGCDRISLTHNGSAALMSIDAGGEDVEFTTGPNTSWISTDAPILEVVDGTVWLIVDDLSTIGDVELSQPCITVEAGATLRLTVMNSASVASNTVEGDGTSFATSTTLSSSIGNLNTATETVTYPTIGETRYIPDSDPDWDPVPTTVAEALDILAALDKLPAGTTGAILVNNGGTWSALAPGAEGTVLTSHSTSGPPTWEVP